MKITAPAMSRVWTSHPDPGIPGQVITTRPSDKGHEGDLAIFQEGMTHPRFFLVSGFRSCPCQGQPLCCPGFSFDKAEATALQPHILFRYADA